MIQVVVTQVPTPAPPPPLPEVITIQGGAPPDWVFVLLTFAVGAVLLWPLIRAIARRIEGRTDAGLQRQVEELEQRVSDLAQREYRMAELEERLDFAERLLAQRTESAVLPPKREG
jgi:hypothetical protein